MPKYIQNWITRTFSETTAYKTVFSYFLQYMRPQEMKTVPSVSRKKRCTPVKNYPYNPHIEEFDKTMLVLLDWSFKPGFLGNRCSLIIVSVWT